MRRQVSWALAGLSTASLLAASAQALTWNLVGTSGITYTPIADNNQFPNGPFLGPDNFRDNKRIKFQSIAVDSVGNVFASSGQGENNGPAGGVTIYKVGGGQIDINFAALPTPFPGGPTQLLLGGDDKVYGALNYQETGGTGHRGWQHRIVRISIDVGGATATVTEVFNPSAWRIAEAGTDILSEDVINGFTVSGTTGWLYFWVNGQQSNFWKNGRNFLRYNTNTGTVQTPSYYGTELTGIDNNNKIDGLAWVGFDSDPSTNTDRFVLLKASGSNYFFEALDWDHSTGDYGFVIVNNSSNPAWRDRNIAHAYDPINKKLWMGGMGSWGQAPRTGPNSTCQNPPTDAAACEGSNTISRWTGNPSNPGALLKGFPTDPGSIPAAAEVWHSNGNAPDSLPQGSQTLANSNGGPYWISAFALSPCDGAAFMSWGGNRFYSTNGGVSPKSEGTYGRAGTYGDVGAAGPMGQVYSVDKSFNINSQPVGLAGANQGAPLAAKTSEVVGLTFSKTGRKVYANVVDMVTGQFKVYVADTNNSTCCNDPAFDVDGNGDVSMNDFAQFQLCENDPTGPAVAGVCTCLDRNFDGKVNDADFTKFKKCAEINFASPSGPFGGTKSRSNVPVLAGDLGCDD